MPESTANFYDARAQNGYRFTTDWFESRARNVWDKLIPQIAPRKILEIGSYEGASTCFLIDTLACEHDLELHCIDTWEGGIEHKKGGGSETDMGAVEDRFHANTQLAVSKAAHPVELVPHRGFSDIELSTLLVDGMQDYFDFIYIDGSHQAPDVLLDAVLSFRLLKTNGVIAFDDYLWAENLSYGVDPVRCPKMAIDAFTTIYCRKTRIITAPLYQLYVQKVSG